MSTGQRGLKNLLHLPNSQIKTLTYHLLTVLSPFQRGDVHRTEG
jgi:hypothetical protein